MTDATTGSAASAPKPRPKYLNVFELGIKLPIPGILSIFHRISGVGLFFLLPFLVYLFDLSLNDPDAALWLVDSPLVKLILTGLLWAYLHHFCAGIRFLFLDCNKGVDLPAARRSSVIVFAVSLMLTIVLGVKLWL